MHMGPSSVLPQILNRCIGDRIVEFPRNREQIRSGRIYVAAPDHHLTIHGDQVRLTKATKKHRFNPSVDLLFQSAASVYGPRVIGVILTGLLNDGAEGISAIKAKGGVAVVQDPKEAEFPQMPLNAIRAASVDYCLPLAQMPALLQELVAQTS
jgi:two-component system chemotaxis response regulator CheB